MRRPVLFAVVLATVMTAGCRKQPDLNVAGEEEKLRAVMAQINTAWETEDIDDLGQDTSRDNRPQALDGDDGVGFQVDVAGDEAVETFHGAFEVADVVPTGRQTGSDHLVHLGVDGVGGAQGLANGASGGRGIVKSDATGRQSTPSPRGSEDSGNSRRIARKQQWHGRR